VPESSCVSSSRGLFDPMLAGDASSGGEMCLEGLRFVGGTDLGLVPAFVCGDFVPCGDEAAGVGVEAWATGVDT
jgi:hypothetical protein